MNKSIFFYSILCLLCCSCDKVDNATSWISDTFSSAIDNYNGEGEDSETSGMVKVKNTGIQYSKNAKASKLMDERRIYLVDLTRSMEGFNGNVDIFDKLKDQLNSTINTMNDTSSEIIIVPFTDRPHEVYSGKIALKDSIHNYISHLQTKSGDTNILEAWNKGISLLDSTKINYMFMLTDGVHNYGEPIDSLYRKLESWHTKTSGKYQFAFYVLLSEKAREQEICRIVDSSKQMWLVPSMNINTDFILGSMNLSVNIIKTGKSRLHLTCTNPDIFNHGFKFKISLPENEYYKIINASETINKDGEVLFEIQKLKPQKDLPVSYKTNIKIDYDKQKFPFVFFTPEEYNLNIVNVGTRIMNIKKLDK